MPRAGRFGPAVHEPGACMHPHAGPGQIHKLEPSCLILARNPKARLECSTRFRSDFPQRSKIWINLDFTELGVRFQPHWLEKADLCRETRRTRDNQLATPRVQLPLLPWRHLNPGPIPGMRSRHIFLFPTCIAPWTVITQRCLSLSPRGLFKPPAFSRL